MAKKRITSIQWLDRQINPILMKYLDGETYRFIRSKMDKSKEIETEMIVRTYIDATETEGLEGLRKGEKYYIEKYGK